MEVEVLNFAVKLKCFFSCSMQFFWLFNKNFFLKDRRLKGNSFLRDGIIFLFLYSLLLVDANAYEKYFVQGNYHNPPKYKSAGIICEKWRQFVQSAHDEGGSPGGSTSIILVPSENIPPTMRDATLCTVQWGRNSNTLDYSINIFAGGCYSDRMPKGGIKYPAEPYDCVNIEWVAAAPRDSPPTSCPVGNPIDTSTGAKIQKESDINSRGFGQIGFDRTYNNSNKAIGGFWYNPYQKSLRIIDPQKIEIVRAKSSPYASKSAACTGGFNDLKTKISDNWTQGSSAQYVNNTCQIVRNNKIIKNIPIVQSAQNTEIYFKPGAIQLIREDGSIYSFGLGAGDQYNELGGARGQLIAISDTPPIAWRYRASNGDVEDYNADGKLLSITASNGMKQELFYDATSGLLARVKDSTNRELTFAYTGNQLSSITVDGNKTTSYTYNGQGLISKVIRPDNSERIYHYEDTRFPTFLTGITDERGKRYATWAYDAQGRAISSEHAGGVDKTQLSFNADGSTTVTNSLGKQTIYRFDDIAGARRVVKVEGQPTANCAGANQNYTYTPEGWVESKTDWKGIKTTYQYNSLGQEISRTEAFGTTEARTITTEWHPTLYLKTKIIESGKETMFSYDVNGRLSNQSTRALSN